MTEENVVPHETIVRHIASFLDTHGYTNALLALQAESGVPYNVIRTDENTLSSSSSSVLPLSKKGFESAVLSGEWHIVLKHYVEHLLLPKELTATIYELILEEFLELHGLFHAAQTLFKNAPIFLYMHEANPSRYARLEKAIQKFDLIRYEEEKRNTLAFAQIQQHFQERRAQLLHDLASLITFSCHPRRPENEFLVKLEVEHAMRLRSGGELGSGTKRNREDLLLNDADTSSFHLFYPLVAPKRIEQKVELQVDHAAATCVSLPSHDNETGITVIGRVDGGLDFVNLQDGTVENSVYPSPVAGVLTLILEQEPEDVSVPSSTFLSPWIGVGYRNGWIKVYDSMSHQLIRKFENAHKLGVTSLAFAGPLPGECEFHHAWIISGSFDSIIKLNSIREGVCLFTVLDSHRSSPITSVCSLKCEIPIPDGTAPTSLLVEDFALLTAGDDCRLGCWWMPPEKEGSLLERVGHAATLHSFHTAFLGNEVVSSLLRLPLCFPTTSSVTREEMDGVSTEVLLVTRSSKAGVLRVRVRPHEVENPIHTEVVCVIEAPHVLLRISPKVVWSTPQSLHMLSLYLFTDDGSILLCNIEMTWRNKTRWEQTGGCVKMNHFIDSSPVLLEEVGFPLVDVQASRVPGWKASSQRNDRATDRVQEAFFVCSPSLNKAFVLV